MGVGGNKRLRAKKDRTKHVWLTDISYCRSSSRDTRRSALQPQVGGFFFFHFFFQILLRLKSATKVLSVHCVILKKREASSKQRRTDTETKVEPEFQILIFAKQAVETDHR